MYQKYASFKYECAKTTVYSALGKCILTCKKLATLALRFHLILVGFP